MNCAYRAGTLLGSFCCCFVVVTHITAQLIGTQLQRASRRSPLVSNNRSHSHPLPELGGKYCMPLPLIQHMAPVLYPQCETSVTGLLSTHLSGRKSYQAMSAMSRPPPTLQSPADSSAAVTGHRPLEAPFSARSLYHRQLCRPRKPTASFSASERSSDLEVIWRVMI